MSEAQDGGLVGSCGYAQIDSGKAAQRWRVIEGLLHAGIRQVEPLLQKISSQHDREAHWLPTVARLGIVRLHQRQQLRPRHHLLHLVQKKLPLALATKPLKTRL